MTIHELIDTKVPGLELPGDLKLLTGVEGNQVWPYAVDDVEFTVAGEVEPIGEQKINFDKLNANPVHVAAALAISNNAIDNADFDLLEERLLTLPALALGQAERVVDGMSRKVRKNVGRSLNLIQDYSQSVFDKVQRKEDLIDKYESKTGDYLIQLTRQRMDSHQTREATMLLRVVGDLERIGDYASNIARLTHKANDEKITFSEDARRDLNIVIEAERDVVNSTITAYQEHDLQTAMRIKPSSAALSYLCEILKARHFGRLSRGECNLTQGTIYTDLLNSFSEGCFRKCCVAGECIVSNCSNIISYNCSPDLLKAFECIVSDRGDFK
jgi:phosphate uptake regulator